MRIESFAKTRRASKRASERTTTLGGKSKPKVNELHSWCFYARIFAREEAFFFNVAQALDDVNRTSEKNFRRLTCFRSRSRQRTRFPFGQASSEENNRASVSRVLIEFQFQSKAFKIAIIQSVSSL
jgi:hypothetical protein